ncbi:DUF6745 domain-containing protein [Actinocorallia libanotica]|uniref:DUF6745 domain-containing protein n=1 Tax=Actinocorallia libanotica TaxID=46162 RepID=A0ABP4CB30_9ACTN
MPFTALRADRPRAEAGVRAAYAAAGLTPPAAFVWLPSPAAGALLSVLLRPGLPPATRTALLATPALRPFLPILITALQNPRPTSPPAPDQGSSAAMRRSALGTAPHEPDHRLPSPENRLPQSEAATGSLPLGDGPLRETEATSSPDGSPTESRTKTEASPPPENDALPQSGTETAASPNVFPQGEAAVARGGSLRETDASSGSVVLEELLAGIEAGAGVRERVRTAPWERERAAARAELGPRGWADVWARTGALTWDRVNELVTRIRRAIGELGGEEHGPLLRAATLDAVLGQHDAPWLELFASLDRLTPLHGLAEVAASAGWWWPYENLVILSDRPTDLHRDEPGRLHRGDGPALAYSDGFALHAWRGMPIPPDFLNTLTGLTASRILAEENAELRRVMLEHFGYDRYLADIGARPLHQDETGVLWRIDLPGDEPVVMVEVVNSTPEPDGTRRTYYLRVPPRTRTARAGVAWTFGLTEAEYRPLQET